MNNFISAPFWTELLVKFGANIIEFIAVVIIYFVLKRVGSKIIARSFDRYKQRRDVSSNRIYTLEKLTASAYTYVLFFIFLVLAFNAFGLPTASLIAGASVIGLAVGFGAQGLVSDVVTGFFILLEKQIDVGDYVTTAGFGGIVEEVGLRTTKIRSFDGTLNYIPNRQIATVSNHTRGNMRALVDLGIAYEENVDDAITVIQEACNQAAENDDRIKEGPDVVGVQAFGSSDIVIRVIAQTENMEQWAVERDLRKAIKWALDTNNIEIPYPHQVNIDKNA
ncbi:mechanosensitive ion channel family protein [Tuberibacillus sp. Marseille-P3662]|uniref:mechanosensitive ion channel family protein n=1 Tax=Tuberibacillus sp. Marseille-P3662 TaxID=1965358 RepID=UPI000A1CAB62